MHNEYNRAMTRLIGPQLDLSIHFDKTPTCKNQLVQKAFFRVEGNRRQIDTTYAVCWQMIEMAFAEESQSYPKATP